MNPSKEDDLTQLRDACQRSVEQYKQYLDELHDTQVEESKQRLIQTVRSLESVCTDDFEKEMRKLEEKRQQSPARKTLYDRAEHSARSSYLKSMTYYNETLQGFLK